MNPVKRRWVAGFIRVGRDDWSDIHIGYRGGRVFLEALCLDPFVHSLDTAKSIMDDYLQEYREYLPQFF